MSLWGELKRRDVFKVAIAYLVASWLIVQVVNVLTDPLSLPGNFDTAVVVLLAIGFPVALIIAWIYEVTPEGVRVTSDNAAQGTNVPSQRLSYVLVVLVLVAAGLMVFNRFVVGSPSAGFGSGSRLAILPCTDLSPDPSNAFFAPGIHSELIRHLGSLSGLDVISQLSVQRFADGRTSIPEIANELRVQAVMQCWVRYSGDRVLLTASLSDGVSDTFLWSRNYEANLSDDLGEMNKNQADLARNVANEMRVEFLGEEIERIQRPPTTSREAYELYIEALALNAAAGGFQEIEALMDEALLLDPEFAEAWSRKSNARSTGFITMPQDARMQALADATEAAERALEFGPELGAPYASMAQIHGIRREWMAAERDWQAARERGDDPAALAMLLLTTGYVEEARPLFESALETDPLNGNLRYWLLLTYEILGDSEAADAAYRYGQRLFESVPWLGDFAWEWIRLGRGDIGPGYESPVLTGALAELPAMIGDPEGGLAVVDRLAADPGYQVPAVQAILAAWAAYFGAPERALGLLEDTVAGTGSGLMMLTAWLPVYDETRRLPAFESLLEDIGLTEYWRRRGVPDLCSPVGDGRYACR